MTAQNKFRSVEELINKTEPGWDFVMEWISNAKNKVEVLPTDSAKADDALYKTQVTTRSPMGAIIYSTGGILIDNGWIRILGSGCSQLSRSLPDWNKGKTIEVFGESPSFLLVADDVIGGFFAINGGGLGEDVGMLYYLSPDNLSWESLEITYSDFLNFCFNGDLEDFYLGLRWNDWKKDISKIQGDEAYSFYPFLWTKQGKDINAISRKPVPVDELYRLMIDFQTQLDIPRT
ncbi:hypothetical protein D3C80_1120270 [compost metagenome]